MTSMVFVLGGDWEVATVGLFAGALLIGYALLVWYIAFDTVDKNFTKGLISRARNFLFAKGGQ